MMVQLVDATTAGRQPQPDATRQLIAMGSLIGAVEGALRRPVSAKSRERQDDRLLVANSQRPHLFREHRSCSLRSSLHCIAVCGNECAMPSPGLDNALTFEFAECPRHRVRCQTQVACQLTHCGKPCLRRKVPASHQVHNLDPYLLEGRYGGTRVYDEHQLLAQP